MRGDEAREILGFCPNSRPNPAEVKAAYKRKAMQSHPDLFPAHQKSQAEMKFKQISEAYSCLKDCERLGNPTGGSYVHVARRGAYKSYSRHNKALIRTPFFLLILATVSFGALNASRAYRKEKEACPSYNPFLP
ncbi:Chaperone protein DnaJ [Rhynchospora pubera]|uniref:Chaperone protein DnaJ n=1 Tax=Rhynchospora pubera TaxID=906938 RepID=A0AAV8FNE0_9POAL|nr:Chaperone protein DnaJ [Rhynchospora pubera]